MDEKLYEMIFKRRSFHLFRGLEDIPFSEEDIREIRDAWQTFTPLDPDIRTAIRIVPAEETTCRRDEQYCILLFSEEKEGYLRNTGYLGEQLDLYLAAKNIGTLWFGIGRPEMTSYEGLAFVIMIAVRRIKDPSKFRRDMYRSKRKSREEIWQGAPVDGVTDIVRFAPSACNTQPWFVRNDGCLFVYRYKKPGRRGIMPADKVTYYNRIDIGIFLCFMDLCLRHCGITFQKELFADSGSDEEFTLNAVYRLDEIKGETK